MAAIHDRYTVLPPQRLRRPGALLRAVLRHKDSAASGYTNTSHQVNHQNRRRQGDTTSVQVLQARAASGPEHSHMHYINPYQFGVGGPDAGAGAAGFQLQGPPTAACTAPPAPPGALSPPSVPSIPARAVVLPPAQHLNPNFSPSNSIRHARSTSSPLPLVSPLVPSALDRRASRLSSPIATMPEYRHMRSGSLSIPSAAHGSSHHSMPRSPPNTSHVPCKFFRQGACQAGNACPFSHDLGAASETICKYFAKGNCKFGPKCANIHVLPDGRRINYGKNGVTIGPNPLNLANRAGGASPVSQTPGSVSSPFSLSTASALTTSLYRADQPVYPYLGDEFQQLGLSSGHDNGPPTIDAPYSVTESSYGSPPDDDPSRLGFGLSPAAKGLSVLDAPLPASFDSNGISNAARFPAAPWPSSVPSKFGLESPSPSLSSIKDSRTSETLKLLHSSAFGSSEHLATPTAGSPPDSQHLTGEEYFGKRIMHSTRYPKPRLLSASMPKNMVDRDWEAEFAFGDDDNVPENLVPGDLQDLLTPAEKARRGSMRDERPDFNLGSLGKYGSPIGSSPSRWGPLFQRQKEEEEMTRSARSAAGSAFGHVGSPLRNSILAKEMSDDLRPSAIRSGSETMSVLSQQLQRSRLDDTLNGSSPLLHPTVGRNASNGISPIGKDRSLERHVSSTSIGSSVTGRFTTPIDEEDPDFVFSMEEEDDSSSSKIRKRGSSGLALGAYSSYANAAAASKTVPASNGTKEGRDAVPVNGR
ncbi:uncharacterized protein Triagg1_5958 [Trichoderma aggressivum f. europaeum]|uniref:C3H1-type domain-containing protein n=1 Tax=Trichoderma aggressivum f. europaeum TaxID=173218 RepID=A0AAE1ICE8_9HYPO|nr:hypothetical protein Triagg1_5958 [Trichoderma aggressivum f. europaeum]